MTHRTPQQRRQRDRWAPEHDPRRKPPGFAFAVIFILTAVLFVAMLIALLLV